MLSTNEFIEIVLHMSFTMGCFVVAHWEGITGLILFALQAAVLIKKLRSDK